MEDTQSTELASEVTQASGLEDSSTQQLNGLVEQAETQVSSEPELSPLQQDKRYTEFWNKDPNKMYDHIKHLESKQSESQSAIKELETLKQERDSLHMQLQTYNKALEDPTTGPIYQQALNDANIAVAKAQYGDLPPEQLAQLQQKDTEMNHLYSKYDELEAQLMHIQQEKIANEATQNILSKAKEYGIDPKLNEFFEYAKNQNLDPNYYEMSWLNMAMPQIIEGNSKKAVEAYVKANQETHKGSVYSSPQKSATPTGSTQGESLKSILERKLKF